MTEFKESAIQYVNMGFALCPLKKGTKGSYRLSWSKDWISTEERACRHWNAHPEDNITILTGKRSGGLIVIDIDRKNGVDGTLAIKEWEKEHGPLPNTLKAQSATGGLHYYYYCDEELRNGANIYEGIDLRGEGGVIVAPPTTIANGQYKWINQLPIAKADSNVLAFIKSGKYEKKNTQKEVSTGGDFTVAPSGSRNVTLTRYIGSLQGQGYSDNTIKKMAYTYNSENCLDAQGNPDPLPTEEVETVLNSILSKPKGSIRLNKIEEQLKQFLFKLKPQYNYSWDDKGNGKLFSDVFVNTFKYTVEAQCWYYFDGRYWIADLKDTRAKKYAIYLSRALEAYSYYLEDGEAKDSYQKYIKKLGNIKDRENMVKDASKYSAIYYADLDSNKNLFNCQNGTYNLETFEFKAHDPKDLISKISNVVYDSEAVSKEWLNFINNVTENDKPKADYIQRILGYSLTALTVEETAFILYGSTTRNGKSTLVETYAHMLGNQKGYSAFAQPETIAQAKRDSRAPSEDIASLRGARFLAMSEPPKGMILDSAFLKQLVGGDTIKARGMYEKAFQYKPQFKMFINTNHLPEIYDNTIFSGEKLWVIPFNRHFTQEEQDKGLKHRLIKQHNLSGIFNWCLDGLANYQLNGLTPPDCVYKATKDYSTTIDKIGNFIEDCMEYEKDAKCDGAIAYDVYRSWCDANGYTKSSARTFYQDLKDNGVLIDNGKIGAKRVRNRINDYKVNPFEYD